MPGKLKPEQREYIAKQYKKGKSAQEIAEELGITADTVNKYEIRMGLRKKNHILEKEPELPKQIKRPALEPGQWLRVLVREGMKGQVYKRDAVVLEPYEKFVTVGIPTQYSDGIIRTSADYWDLVHKVPLVM